MQSESGGKITKGQWLKLTRTGHRNRHVTWVNLGLAVKVTDDFDPVNDEGGNPLEGVIIHSLGGAMVRVNDPDELKILEANLQRLRLLAVEIPDQATGPDPRGAPVDPVTGIEPPF